MTRWMLPHPPPTEARNAAVVASVITTFLSPFLAYAAAGAASGYPGTGTVIGLFIVPFFPMVAPLQFAFVFVCALAIGLVLPLCRATHIASFAFAGAVVAVAASAMVPILVGLGGRPPFLAENADAIHLARMILVMAGAGAVNGAIYWLLMNKFSRPREMPVGEKRIQPLD